MATKAKRIILYIALILLALACIFPFWLTMVNATRTGADITKSFTLIPGKALLDNWAIIDNYFNLFHGMANSLKIAIPSTILTAYFSAITAYALAVYKFKGRNLLFYVIVIFMMIPGQLGLIGFYDLCTKMRLIDTYIPLIIPAIAAPGTVFFLRQYVQSSLSPALLEAARIDGAGELLIFHKIVLPIMAPGIATMSIMGFIGSWNAYLIPMLLLNTPSKFPLPVMVATLKSSTDMQSNQGAIYLTVAISVIPILVVFCFCSRYIISSISAGSVKE